MGLTSTVLSNLGGSAHTVANSLVSNAAPANSPATNSVSGKAATPSKASSAANQADITSNDFLTLLVTEMQNQDPTQPTDPNAYIQQLVGVNSLQQLVAINQGIAAL